MVKQLLFLLATALLFSIVLGDCYMHNPRGSNGRLNGRGANRNNGNRLMDTQNNGAGGYCWGPPMTYYTGSLLPIEWTTQHGCGHPNCYCEIVIQIMCADYIRDGNTTNTIPDNANTYNQTNADGYFVFGMHEHYDYYQRCKNRERNQGLYIANNNLQNRATRTRQNNGGTRRGFECPEERDYYPYWHPTPWVDIAVFSNNKQNCDIYQKDSQNVAAKGYCDVQPENNNRIPNLESTCPTGSWKTVPAWKDTPGFECFGAPECLASPWNRPNHLGNGVGGRANTYNWTIPDCLAGKKCTLRIRYNISTADYDPWNTDWRSNRKAFPNANDPYIYMFNLTGATGHGCEFDFNKASNRSSATIGVRLAINTDQFGRTFQDRSHIFYVESPPPEASGCKRLFNLNVRGKRGNIVQAYPAVEYDFAPSDLNAYNGDCLHIQWTGCDTNPNNFAGEGRAGTDRSNMVQIEAQDRSRPIDYVNIESSRRLFPNCRFAFYAAFLGQDPDVCKTRDELNNNDQDPNNCFLLNQAYTYVNLGILKLDKTGTFHYMSSRNNNFTNRSQKGSISVYRALRNFGIAIVAVGSAAFAVALVFAGLAAVAQCAPSSSIGQAAMFNAK